MGAGRSGGAGFGNRVRPVRARAAADPEMPGASLLGEALEAGSELTAAYVAPGQNWALAVTASGPASFF